MTSAEQIRVLCVRSKISISELARRLGQTPQNFSAKLNRNTIGINELKEISHILNVEYKNYFLLPNGEQIE